MRRLRNHSNYSCLGYRCKNNKDNIILLNLSIKKVLPLKVVAEVRETILMLEFIVLEHSKVIFLCSMGSVAWASCAGPWMCGLHPRFFPIFGDQSST